MESFVVFPTFASEWRHFWPFWPRKISAGQLTFFHSFQWHLISMFELSAVRSLNVLLRPEANPAEKLFLLDTDIENYWDYEAMYRRRLFWVRLGECFTMYGMAKETDDMLNDIFLFDKLPEGKNVMMFCREKLGKTNYDEAGPEFWGALFMQSPFVFIFSCYRMLGYWQDQREPMALSFRMDGTSDLPVRFVIVLIRYSTHHSILWT